MKTLLLLALITVSEATIGVFVKLILGEIAERLIHSEFRLTGLPIVGRDAAD